MSATGDDESFSVDDFLGGGFYDDEDDFGGADSGPLREEDWEAEWEWSGNRPEEPSAQTRAMEEHEAYFGAEDKDEDEDWYSRFPAPQEDESLYPGEASVFDEASDFEHDDFFKNFGQEEFLLDSGEQIAGQLGPGGEDGSFNLAQMFGSSAVGGKRRASGRQSELAEWSKAETQGTITRLNDPLIPQGEVNFVSVKLQSPSDIRRESMWRREIEPKQVVRIAEVLALQDAPGRAGHLQCPELFGESFAMRRANRGFMALPWPVPHIWLTGAPGRMAKVSQMLSMKPSDVKTLREFTGKRMYLGEWLAPDVYPLHVHVREGEERYLGKMTLWHPLPMRLPSMGSPAAAAEPPRLHTFSTPIRRAAASVGPQSDTQSGTGAEGLLHLARPTLYALTLAQEAVEQARVATPEQDMATKMALSACEAKARAEGHDREAPSSEDFRRAAAKCIELQKLVEQLADPPEEMKGLLSMSVKMLCQDCNLSEAQALDMIEEVFTPRREPPSLDTSLHRSAQKSMFDVWVQLALPGTGAAESGALEEQLRNFAEQVEHLENEDERNELRSVVANLTVRAHAALDLVLALADPQANDSQSQVPAETGRDVQRSRFHSGPQEICCYETRMPVAAFQEADVRLYKDLVLNVLDVKGDAEGSISWKAEAEDSERPSETSPPSGDGEHSEDYNQVESQTEEHGTEEGDEEVEDEEVEDANLATQVEETSLGRQDWSFHIPLQDSERVGCAGGARPIELGEMYSKELALALARHCATRPRHPTVAPTLPSNLELEGCWITSDGGVGLQQMLSRVDPAAQAQAVGRQIRFVDDMIAAMTTSEVSKTSLTAVSSLAGWHEQLKFQNCRASLPEWSILTDLPVMPPSLRDDGEFDERTSGINHSYNEVLEQAEQLRIAAETRKSSGSIASQKQALAVAVDRVIDMARAPGQKSAAYMKFMGDDSVAARIKGKPGRVRQNLLGKRVNYSCRSVIVSEPSLRLDEVGLPIEMAMTLFDAFVFKEARYNDCYPELKDFFEKPAFKQEFIAYVLKTLPFEKQKKLLEDAIGDRRVFINRQPSLHRLSMQAMSVRLFDGKAIRLHPLVTGPFNADFDGDTMVVHLALSDKAQEDLKNMVPTANLFSPAHGGCAIGPSQDMVLGLYYMTADSDVEDHAAEPLSFSSLEAALDAWKQQGLPHTQHVRIPEETLRNVNETIAELILGLPAKPEVGDADQQSDRTVTLSIGRLLFFMQLASGSTSGVAHMPGEDQREIEKYMDAV